MSGLGTYLYGIMRAGTEIPAGLPGIDDDAPVCAFDCGRLAASTSLVPRDGFESDGPADPAWVVPRALRHELLIEKMLAPGPILPVRFGALFSTTQRTRGPGCRSTATRSPCSSTMSPARKSGRSRFRSRLEAAFETLIARDPAWAEKARSAWRLAPGTRYFQEKRLREEARRTSAREGASRPRSCDRPRVRWPRAHARPQEARRARC